MAWHSVRLSVGSPRGPGPGFFPFCLSLILIGVAIVIFAQGTRRPAQRPEAGLKRRRVALALGAIFAYAFLLELVGYLLSTFLLMLLLLRLMVKRGWWFAPGVACVISLVSYVIFKIWLKVLLPPGFLSF